MYRWRFFLPLDLSGALLVGFGVETRGGDSGQKRAASEGRRSTKLAMPDTDDEGSVAENASDAGGGAREASNTRRRTGVEAEDSKVRRSDRDGERERKSVEAFPKKWETCLRLI